MDWGATKTSGESRTIGCECGVTLEIQYARQAGHNEKEEFNCPKCEREHSVMASMPIRKNDIKIVKD